MVFWASFLVFMAGIMLYMFFPRNDLYETNMYQEEGNIITFVNQHQAAKDHMYQLLVWNPTDPVSSHIYIFPYNDLENMLPHGMTSSIYGQPKASPSARINPDDTVSDSVGNYTSALVCLDNDKNLVKCQGGTEQYVITYGYKPDWWEDRAIAHPNGVDREAWFKALLKRTYGSQNCGLLSYRGKITLGGATTPLYAINNSQKLKGFATVSGIQNVIYPSITKALISANVKTCSSCLNNEIEDLFFCMTPASNPYDPTPEFQWDILNNTGTGSNTSAVGKSIIPLGTTLSSDQIDITLSATDKYTISGVVSANNADVENVALLNIDSSNSFIKAGCPSGKCKITVGGITISDIPNRGFGFAYTANANTTDKQILKVFYTNKDDGVLKTLSATSADAPVALNYPILKWNRALSGTSKYPTLLDIRIYKSILDNADIKKNLKVDRKRFSF